MKGLKKETTKDENYLVWNSFHFAGVGGRAASVRSLCGTGRSKQPEQSGGFCAGNGYLHHAWTCGSSFFHTGNPGTGRCHGFCHPGCDEYPGRMGGRHRLPGGSGTGIQLASGEYEDNGSEGKAYVILCENGFQEAVKPEAAPIFPQCTVSSLGASQIPGKGRNGSLPDRGGG